MRLGRYTLISRLGAGGFGEVWRAALEGELGFRKPVAIKLLSRSVTPSLVNEARIGARLHHPNVIDVYEIGHADGRWFLAMELVEGRTVEDLVRAHPEGVPPELAVAIVRQVAEGLAYAHGLRDEDGAPLGLVHRDLKPANLMMTGSGLVKILDFGLAVFRDAERDTRPGTVRGTPCYLSPEQAESRPSTSAVDLWALGAIAHALATGRPLVPDGPPLQVLARIGTVDPAAASERVGAKVPALAGIVRGCLQRDPAARPTADEVARELAPSTEVVVRTAPPAPSAPTFQLEPPRARRRWGALVGIVLLVAGLAGAWLVGGGPEPWQGGTLVIGMSRARGTLDVYGRTRTMANSALQLVLEPLVRVDRDGEPRPLGVARWQARDGDRTFLLTPRTTLAFHPSRCTGERPAPVTAADIAFSLRAAVAAEFVRLPLADQDAIGVVPDGVELRLSEPMPLLPQLLGSVPLLPSALSGCDDPRNLAWPVGTGPFRFAEAPMGEKLALVRNEGWVGEPAIHLDGVVFRAVADDREAIEQVARGELTLAELAEATDLLPEGLRLAYARSGRRVALKGLVAFRNGPTPLADAAARRALSQGIDRSLVREVRTRSQVEPGDRFLAARWLGQDPALVAPAGDLDALAAHGELLLGAFESDRRWADAIASALVARGVRVRVVTISLSTLDEATTPGAPSPVDLALVELHGETWGTVDPWPYLVQLTTAVDEVGFVDDELRLAMRAASRTADRRERARTYANVERELLEGMPLVPLGWLAPESTGRTFVWREGSILGSIDPETGAIPGDEDPFLALARAIGARGR